MQALLHKRPLTALLCLLAAAPALIAATSLEPPRLKCVPGEPQYLHASEDAPDPYWLTTTTNPGGRFDAQPPTEDNVAPATQTTVGRWAGSWETSWSGPIDTTSLCGHMSFLLYVSTQPTATIGHLVVRYGPGQVGGDTGPVEVGNSVAPQEFRASVPVEPGLADELSIYLRTNNSVGGPITVLYDHADYPSQFTPSILVPCEQGDPHPDCQDNA